MQIRNIIAALCVISASLFTTSAVAGGYYLTLEKTDYTLSVHDSGQVCDLDNNTRCDGSDNQIRLGYQAHENFAIELLYGANGDLEKAYRQAGVGVDGDSYYGVMLRPGTQLASWLRINATLGMVRGGLFDSSDSFAFGVGLEFTPSDVFSIIGGWAQLADDSNSRVEGLNVGIKFRFGGDDD
jgi:hypothetical protein